jgi:hypothetical protein|tara:strand:- start:326 stop:532 length:207 start_codon:yes stop_codon:yes gene_type:complete
MKTNLTQSQLDQLAELITFKEDDNGVLTIQDVWGDVKGDVWGSVLGNVKGDVKGNFWGTPIKDYDDGN